MVNLGFEYIEARLLRAFACLGLAVACCGVAEPTLADELRVPAHILNRQGQVIAVYHLDKPATGTARLEIEWTDSENRVVERRALEIALRTERDVKITLDPERAIAMLNSLRVRISIEGKTPGGGTEHRQGDEHATFTVVPAAHGWSDYEIIMWHERTVEQLAVLKRLGISAGKVNGNRIELADVFMKKQAEPLLQSNLRWYVENIATDFYSAYHRWFPDRPENWRFLEAKELYRRDLTSRAAFIRDPSLSDPTWLSKISDRLTATVRLHRPYRPLYYNLGDEPGVQDLASFWDFDLSEPSLQQMRLWLKQRYPSLRALNDEWGTHFRSWNDVVPMTTREAMQRTDDNFAPWADFKEWMDVAFARGLRMGTDAVHRADPEALAGIEGAQIPGWGGYNYAHLAHAVDLMEIYDFAGNVDIVRSLNSKLIFLTTSGGGGAEDQYRIWRELLRGSHGLILWDDKSALVRPDGSLGSWAEEIRPVYHELRGGLGALLIDSERVSDPVAILYSPESMRTQWMLDRKPEGDAWIGRDADAEYQDNAIRSSTRHFTEAFDALGLSYRYLTSELIARGALERERYRVLVLPHAIALSPEAAGAIRRFAANGGFVIADEVPGKFDGHSRRLASSTLADLFTSSNEVKGRTILLAPPAPASLPESRECLDPAALQPLAQVLASAQVRPRFTIAAADGSAVTNVDTYAYRSGGALLIALQKTECRRPTSTEAQSSNDSQHLVLSFARDAYVYDVRAQKLIGHQSKVEIALDRTSPTILAVAPRELSAPEVRVPTRVRHGETVMLQVRLKGTTPEARRVLRVEVLDPEGKIVSAYSGNMIAARADIAKRLTLAFNDPSGEWRIRVTDVLSGQSQSMALSVSDR